MRSHLIAAVALGAALAACGQGQGDAKAVDVCALVPKAAIETVVGTLAGEPSADPANGPFLGGCNYPTAGGLIVVSARPASDYEAMARRGEPRELAGIGERAVTTKTGVLVKLAGKPYFIHVLAASADADGADNATAAAVAKLFAK